jgi:hypothetical protein
MKISRLIVPGLIGMFLTLGLTGCKIISASPDPKETVEIRLGESKTISVKGPAENEDTFYWWSLTNPVENLITSQWSGKQFTFSADPQKYPLCNKMILECVLWQKRLIFDCPVQRGCGLFLEEVPVDKRVWNIRILQDGSVWHGDYYMEDKTDINFISGFTSTDGSLYIRNTQLLNLYGLENMKSVGRELVIEDNFLLKSLTGIDNLTSIGGNLVIENNLLLKSLTGLDNLTSIGGNLVIGGLNSVNTNLNLTSLRGLEKLKLVGGDLIISSNKALTSFSGLENLTSIGRSLWIEYNDDLTSLTGLENIKSVSGGLGIYSNGALTSLSGLDNLISVGELLYITGNIHLRSLSGLGNLTSVGGLAILVNDALTNLAPLGKITSVGRDLEISNNDTLASLTGLENITSIGGDLFIMGNDVLTSLAALENLISVGSLDIYSNDALTALGMAALKGVGSDFLINYNPKLCRSLAEELMNQVLAAGGIGGTRNIDGNKECITP